MHHRKRGAALAGLALLTVLGCRTFAERDGADAASDLSEEPEETVPAARVDVDVTPRRDVLETTPAAEEISPAAEAPEAPLSSPLLEEAPAAAPRMAPQPRVSSDCHEGAGADGPAAKRAVLESGESC